MQNGPDSVLVSWTAPSVPPGDGYHIAAYGPVNASANATTSPHDLTIDCPGVYTIQVTSLSQDLPGGTVEVEGVIVRGIARRGCTCVIICHTIFVHIVPMAAMHVNL